MLATSTTKGFIADATNREVDSRGETTSLPHGSWQPQHHRQWWCLNIDGTGQGRGEALLRLCLSSLPGRFGPQGPPANIGTYRPQARALDHIGVDLELNSEAA